MDVRRYNRAAWDQCVEQGDRWTRPVSPAEIEQARAGILPLLLTPTRPVPAEWLGDVRGQRILGLASGGGQQAPLLAATGAIVTVLDNSPRQLEQDQSVARREGLELELVEGDMADLSPFASDSFDLVFHPCANAFVPDVLAVWRECFRVLRPGGRLLAGFTNPVRYLFADERLGDGRLEVCHPLPYSDVEHLSAADRQRLIAAREPLEFGHTLEDQIGGQLAAGFVLHGCYEDRYPESDGDPLSRYLSTFMATWEIKPSDSR